MDKHCISIPQHGMATLLFTLILLLSASILAYTVSHSTLETEKILGTNIRQQEVEDANNSALSLGGQIIKQQALDWQPFSTDQQQALYSGIADTESDSGEFYRTTLTFIRTLSDPQFITTIARSQSNSNANINNIQSQIHFLSNTQNGIDVITLPGTWRDFE